MDREEVLPNQTVIVENGRISYVGAARSAPAGATMVDGRGKFLMPGMAEMHAHIPGGPSATDADMHRTLLLFAANGITTIRGMLGEPRHLPLREAVADEILPQFQDLAVGDALPLGASGPVMRVAVRVPERTLVLRSDDGAWVWIFVLRPAGDGTRLISWRAVASPAASMVTPVLAAVSE